MQAVLAIPAVETLQKYAAAGDEVLMENVAGVPLVLRVMATAARARVDSVLVIWPGEMNAAILESYAESSLLKNIHVENLVWPNAFDPQNPTHWAAIEGRLPDGFLWLPWNWVTHRRSLAELSGTPIRPRTWEFPVVLEKRALFYHPGFHISPCLHADGVQVNSRTTLRIAERFLVANSGKPSDGIYSSFNRRLCRPLVRLLTHTRLTPNVITLAGLLVASFVSAM